MKLIFKACPPMLAYNGDCGTFEDGQVREIEATEAERLLRDFPKNFKKAEPVRKKGDKKGGK